MKKDTICIRLFYKLFYKIPIFLLISGFSLVGTLLFGMLTNPSERLPTIFKSSPLLRNIVWVEIILCIVFAVASLIAIYKTNMDFKKIERNSVEINRKRIEHLK